jgi:DHA3 family macrolide efflux protein-like MFS transporter
MLPRIFLGPFAGPLIDRHNRRRIMILADSGIAVSTMLLALLFAFGFAQVWHIYTLMFLRSLGQAFHGPAFAASTSLMVPKEHLARIQGLNQFFNGGLTVIAAPLGAFLLELMPMQAVLSIDVATALIAIGAVLPVSIPQPVRERNGADGNPISFWEDFREGYQYVLSWRGMLVIAVMAVLINFLLTPAGSLTPLLITKHFGKGVLEYGWFEGTSGLAVILGSLLLTAWGGTRKKIITTFAGLILMGLAFGAIGFLPSNGFTISLGLIFIAAFMVPLVNGTLGAVMQATVDPARQGRVFTLTGSVSSAMTPLGLLIAGPISDAFGTQSWFIVGGLLCAVMGVIGFFIPSVMNIEAGRPETKHTEAQDVANSTAIEAT